MTTARRLIAAKAIRSLLVDEFDKSCDKNEDITARSVIQATLENSDLSDCDSDEPSHQPISENFMRRNLQSIDGTLFQVEPAFHVSESAKRQTEKELQLKIFFLKDRDQHHILKEVSNQKVHSAHLVCLLMSPCFVKFKNIPSSMDKLMQKFFCKNLRIGKIYWSPNSTWCFDGKKHSNSSTVE